MCGIVGLHGNQEPAWINEMNARQIHRGPDDAGVFRDTEARLSLAMHRLAIIDLRGGVQPMQSSDGRYTLVYNGEIFNALELRTELAEAGVCFSTDHSDTEVLLHLLIRVGHDCLPRLNGMFAFAFYDAEKKIITCARDRFGIKPLHYVARNGRFAFASEIKSLLTLPFVSNELNLQAAFDYLSLLYIPGEQTAFADIQRVPSGGLLRYELATSKVTVERWWRMDFHPDTVIPGREWPELIAAELKAAVKRWVWSDVPVAVSLSGGLDSSAIAGYAAQSGILVRSFSLGFKGVGEESWNELPLARKVAEKWGLAHEEIALDPEVLIDELPSMVSALDEPYGGGLPSWFVFKAMGRSVKVCITGTGGDEMFGNYGKWTSLEAGIFGRRIRKANINLSSFERYFFARYYYATDSVKRDLFNSKFSQTESTIKRFFTAFQNSHSNSIRDAIARLDIETQLSDEFLLMTDRFSMAHALEARTPFLDNGFVDLVSQIPANLRTSPKELKGLLRKAVANILPPELITAPKKGFVMPLGKWMQGRLKPLIEEYLGHSYLKRQQIFDPVPVSKYVQAHLAGRADHTHKLWGMLMFQLWYEGRGRA